MTRRHHSLSCHAHRRRQPRKGWDVLLEAYLAEFSNDDDVEMYILTKPFGDSGDQVCGGRGWLAGRGSREGKESSCKCGAELFTADLISQGS